MDMKVFVDADPDVRLSRRSANFYFCFVLFFFSHKLLELDTIHDTLVP